MAHLTGLAALAATDSSADKATTTPGFTDGISVWKDPMAALKALPNTFTEEIKANPAKAMGILVVPIGLLLILTTIMKKQ